MLDEAGARQISQANKKGLTGIEIALFAVIAVQALANLIIRLLPLSKSGIIVDARGSKVSIRKDKRLANGDDPRGDGLIGVSGFLEEPEAPVLLGPVERDVAAHQIGECELGRLGAIDDGTRDVGSEIGQPDQAADIGPRAAVFPSEFVQRLAVL